MIFASTWGYLVFSRRSAPVVALVSLCVAGSAMAVPPVEPSQPAQPVTVVNESVPVTVGNADIDVNVINTPDVWATTAFGALPATSFFGSFCTSGGDFNFHQIPTGYRFVIETVSAHIVTDPGTKVQVALTGHAALGGPTESYRAYLNTQTITDWLGPSDVWIVTQSVMMPADFACIDVQVDELGSTVAQMTLTGHLVRP